MLKPTCFSSAFGAAADAGFAAFVQSWASLEEKTGWGEGVESKPAALFIWQTLVVTFFRGTCQWQKAKP